MPASRRLASSTFAQTPYVHHGRRDVVPAPPTTGARLAQTLMRAHGDGAASFNATATPSLVNDATLGAYRHDDREVSRQSSSRPGTARSNKEQERSMCKYSFRGVSVLYMYMQSPDHAVIFCLQSVLFTAKRIGVKCMFRPCFRTCCRIQFFHFHRSVIIIHNHVHVCNRSVLLL